MVDPRLEAEEASNYEEEEYYHDEDVDDEAYLRGD